MGQTYTQPAGSTGQPVEVGANTEVGFSGTGRVEYSLDTLADFRNGVAVWGTLYGRDPSGKYHTKTPMLLRVVATTGSATMTVQGGVVDVWEPPVMTGSIAPPLPPVDFSPTAYITPSGSSAGDAAVINSAIQSIASSGGGSVYLAGGLFDLETDVVMQANVELVGQGLGTILRQRGGNPGSRQNCVIATNIPYFALRRMVLDGNRSNQPVVIGGTEADNVGNCLRLQRTTKFLVDSVELANAPFHGCIGTAETGTATGTELRGGLFHNCEVYNNGYRSIHFHGTGYGSAGNVGNVHAVTIQASRFHNNGLGLFAMFSRGGGFKVIGNNFWDEPYGICVEGYNQEVGEAAGDNSVYNIIANNVMRNVHVGVLMQNAAKKLVCEGNVIECDGLSGATAYSLTGSSSVTPEGNSDIAIRGGLASGCINAISLSLLAMNNIVIDGVTMTDSLNGFIIQSSATGTKRVRVQNCEIRRMTGKGLITTNTGAYTQIYLENNVIYKCATGGGDINGISRGSVSRNKVNDSTTTTQLGFFIASSNNMRVDQNDIWQETAGPTGGGITITNTCTNINGSGNNITVAGTAISNSGVTSTVT